MILRAGLHITERFKVWIKYKLRIWQAAIISQQSCEPHGFECDLDYLSSDERTEVALPVWGWLDRFEGAIGVFKVLCFLVLRVHHGTAVIHGHVFHHRHASHLSHGCADRRVVKVVVAAGCIIPDDFLRGDCS